MTNAHSKLSNESAFVGEQNIVVKTLDSVFENIVDSDNNIFLKIDTQGYEKKVILGALNSLEKIVGIQIEVSMIELYKEDVHSQGICKRLMGDKRESIHALWTCLATRSRAFRSRE